MIGAAPTSPRTGVPGWLTNAEEDLLAELAAQLSYNDVFVGIGVEYGRSMSVIAHSSASRYIYGVELKPLPAYDANMKEAGLAGRTAILIGDSADVGERWEGDEIAMLFIDGAHEYPAVLADLNNWTPFVKQGGVVVLHDVACATNKLPHALHYEVKRALDEWSAVVTPSIWQFETSVDSMVVMRRRYAPDPAVNSDRSGITFAAGKAVRDYYAEDADTALSKQSAPAELTPTTDMVDVDDEVHAPVDPGIYDEPKEKPKRRTRKSKK